jgi:hypothetical protein
MRCSDCGQRFAAGNQAAPGGKAAPGVFLLAGGIAAAIGGALYVAFDSFTARAWAWVALGIAVLSFSQVPIAMYDSLSMGPGLEPEKGIRCPKCQKLHRVWPWSF